MTYLDLKTEAVAKGNLQLLFPKADSVAIAPTAIGENEQAVGIRVVSVSRPFATMYGIESTANSEVSRLVPTHTKPSFRIRS